MYSKDELLNKDITELGDIAQKLDINIHDSKSLDDLVYQILDRQAETSANHQPDEGKRRNARPDNTPKQEAGSATADVEAAERELASIPKHRGP